MDEEHKMDEGLVKQLFENGLMGIEADPEYGGSGANFLTCMLVCEEISKVSSNLINPKIHAKLVFLNRLTQQLLHL
jgi:short-chain 2-methylacyl-CoA dehydrogenase